jgi:hypothetical protein
MSGLYVAEGTSSIVVPEHPTREDAQRAAHFIYEELFSDFPIDDPAAASVMLSALLTINARFAIKGACPGFMIDGSGPGVGKLKITQTIATVTTGVEATVYAPEHRDEEWRKRVVAILRDAHAITLIDNIAGLFGSPALDAVLTAEKEYGDRLLGVSESWRGPVNTVWFFTANNVILRGDIARRLLPIRIVSRDEEPDARTKFRHPDLLAAARRLRPEILRAVFTILRAWWCAGMPDQGLTAFGSFEHWSKVVREAVVWCGWADPKLAARYLREQPDEDVATFRDVLKHWWQMQTYLCLPATAGPMPPHTVYDACCQRHQQGHFGITMQELLGLFNHPVSGVSLREALQALFPDSAGIFPSAQKLGLKLYRWKDRVLSGLSLRQRMVRGDTYWYIQQHQAEASTTVGVVR